MGLGKILSSVLDATPVGKLIDKAVDAVFPDKLSEGEKAQFKLQMETLDHERKIQLMEKAAEVEAEFNQRVKDLEGTAADLKAIPWLGPIVIFLRGVQRPLWGFATLYMDMQWFMKSWGDFTDRQETALLVINVLVLGFLFGERAMKNVMPLIVKIWGPKGT